MWADHRCHRVQRYHGGLTPPALGAGTTSIRSKKTVFAMNNRTFSRAAGVSPPWFYEPHLQVERDEFRRLDRACGVHPTGGLRPPLLVAGTTSVRWKKTIFAVHKRTFARAAGVSPPWFGRHVYADTRAIARKTAGSMWADHRCHRVQRYHGGLTPPAPGRECER
jgi:hypothetical protein